MKKAGRVSRRMEESVQELEGRLGRAEALMETELQPLCASRGGKSEVYR